MNKYEKYKDSGIEWIGEIPEHWEVKRIKYIISYQKGRNPKDLKIVWNDYYEIYLAMDYLRENPKQVNYVEDPENYVLVNENDILLLWDGSNAGEFIKSKKGILSSTMAVLNLVSIQKDYSYHFLKTFEKYLKESTIGMGIPHVNGEEFKNSIITIPTDSEQSSIAHYLDRKTAEIDNIISNKQKLIALYEEEKQAIINQAVTTSIQGNVAYKKTITDWLDEIPNSWQFLTMKRLVSTKITDGPHETPEFIPDGVPFLSAESVKNGKLDFDFRRGNISKELDELYSKKCKPKRDDIFIVKSGSTTGKIAIVDFDDDFNIWSPLALVRVNEKVKPYFLYYALQSFYFQKQIQLSWSFGTQPNIGMNVIENLKVAVPISLEEQESIISYIESELKRLDAIIEKFHKQIDLLQEYRTTLISEVVTGKIKVC